LQLLLNHEKLYAFNQADSRRAKIQAAVQESEQKQQAELTKAEKELEQQFASKLAAASASLGSTFTLISPKASKSESSVTLRASGWLSILDGKSTRSCFVTLRASRTAGCLSSFQRKEDTLPVAMIFLGIGDGSTVCTILSRGECKALGYQFVLKVAVGGEEIHLLSCQTQVDCDGWAEAINDVINPRLVRDVHRPSEHEMLVSADDVQALSDPKSWVVTRTQREVFTGHFVRSAKGKDRLGVEQLAELLGNVCGMEGWRANPDQIARVARLIFLGDTETGDDAAWIGLVEFCAACFLLQRGAEQLPTHIPVLLWTSLSPDAVAASTREELDAARLAGVQALEAEAPSSISGSTDSTSEELLHQVLDGMGKFIKLHESGDRPQNGTKTRKAAKKEKKPVESSSSSSDSDDSDTSSSSSSEDSPAPAKKPSTSKNLTRMTSMDILLRAQAHEALVSGEPEPESKGKKERKSGGNAQEKSGQSKKKSKSKRKSSRERK
jgi:hypothetical protein